MLDDLSINKSYVIELTFLGNFKQEKEAYCTSLIPVSSPSYEGTSLLWCCTDLPNGRTFTLLLSSISRSASLFSAHA